RHNPSSWPLPGRTPERKAPRSRSGPSSACGTARRSPSSISAPEVLAGSGKPAISVRAAGPEACRAELAPTRPRGRREGGPVEKRNRLKSGNLDLTDPELVVAPGSATGAPVLGPPAGVEVAPARSIAVAVPEVVVEVVPADS